MSLSKFKRRLAVQLRIAADAISPPPAPVILPASANVPTDDAERARLYDRIAYTALAWMAHAKLEARVAAASILKRTYPGIDKHITSAHADAMAFQSQLHDLLAAEERQAQADEAAGEVAP